MDKPSSKDKKIIKKPARVKGGVAVRKSVVRAKRAGKTVISKDEVLASWVSLPEAAQKIGYVSVPFLTEATRQGKLKSFKIGFNWFTTDEWIEEYKQHIKLKIDEEINLEPEEPAGFKWVNARPKKPVFLKIKIPSLAAVTTMLLMAFVGAGFILSVASLQPTRLAILRLDDSLNYRFFVANNFLTVTGRLYATPIGLEGLVLRRYLGILDQGSAVALTVQNNIDNKILRGGRSLANLDISFDIKKFNDEELTAKWQSHYGDKMKSQLEAGIENIKKVGNKIMPSRRYGQVAGATEVAEQLRPVAGEPVTDSNSLIGTFGLIKSIFSIIKTGLKLL